MMSMSMIMLVSMSLKGRCDRCHLDLPPEFQPVPKTEKRNT
jgi:hypothetical protein